MAFETLKAKLAAVMKGGNGFLKDLQDFIPEENDLNGLCEDAIFIDFFEAHLASVSDQSKHREFYYTFTEVEHVFGNVVLYKIDRKNKKDDVIKIICLIEARYQAGGEQWNDQKPIGNREVLANIDEEFKYVKSLPNSGIPENISTLDDYVDYKREQIINKTSPSNPAPLKIKSNANIASSLNSINENLKKIFDKEDEEYNEDTCYTRRIENNNIIIFTKLIPKNGSENNSNSEDIFTISPTEITALKPSNDQEVYIAMLKAAICAYEGKDLEICVPENFNKQEKEKIQAAIEQLKSEKEENGEKFPKIMYKSPSSENLDRDEELANATDQANHHRPTQKKF